MCRPTGGPSGCWFDRGRPGAKPSVVKSPSNMVVGCPTDVEIGQRPKRSVSSPSGGRADRHSLRWAAVPAQSPECPPIMSEDGAARVRVVWCMWGRHRPAPRSGGAVNDPDARVTDRSPRQAEATLRDGAVPPRSLALRRHIPSPGYTITTRFWVRPPHVTAPVTELYPTA